MMTQDGDTELSLIFSSRRMTARGDSCKEAIGKINLRGNPRLSVTMSVATSVVRRAMSTAMSTAMPAAMSADISDVVRGKTRGCPWQCARQ